MNTASESKGKYIKANGLDIYYQDYGKGDPLVLIHGGTLNADFNWNSPGISAILAEHFHVYLPDSRGHGKTNNPGREVSYALMADDMAAFINALGLEKPLVGGWSDGGQISLELGMRHPEMAKGLVIGAAWHRFTETYFELLESWGLTAEMDFEKSEKIPFFIDFAKIWKNLHGEDRWREMLKEFTKMFWTSLDYSSEDFQKVSVPALVLLGDRDEGIPVEIGVEMYEMLPKGELAIAPNAKHNFPWEYPAAFAQTVIDFAARCSEQSD